MAPSPSKTLSPAELAKLEHAFATDPSSDAYKPLAEAYLGMGRFMEAMVVCKKGVKAHPTLADPRVLLARVYAEQGKDKKALEEAMGALGVAPADKVALRTAGNLQLKVGEADAGKANLLKAFDADPNDAETKELLAQWKVETPKPAVAAAPVAAAPAVPMAGPGTAAPGSTAGPRPSGQRAAIAAGPPPSGPAGEAVPPRATGQRPALSMNGAEADVPRATGSRPALSNDVAPRATGSRPAVRPSGARAAVRPFPDDDDEVSDAPERRPAKKSGSNTSRALFLVMVIAAPLILGGWFFFDRQRKVRNREIKKALEAATEQLKHDSYDSYKKACEAAVKALEIDPVSVPANAYLAYAYAIRWGEHGGGDDAKTKAQQYLAAAKAEASDEPFSHLIAAEALFETYNKNGAQALKGLEDRVKAFDEKGQASSLLSLTLGLIQMNAGDLERSRENLEKAQALAPDDPRIYAALGNLYRRRGQDQIAWKNFDFALRYEKDHPESLLGKSLLILDQEDPAFGEAAKMLKKLTEAEPPPSPRQLATAHMAKALLISKVSTVLPDYKPEFQKELVDQTGVPLDKAKAQAELQKQEDTAFQLDRANPELLLIKGKRLLSEGQTEAAANEIRAAIKQDASRAQFHVELARALMRKQGGEKEAQEALQTALRAMGDSPKLMVMLGQVLARQGKLDEAIAQYQKAVADPKAKNPEARLLLGTALREKKDFVKAAEALDRAAQEFIGQPARIAAAYTQLGRVYEEKGDRPKADETYTKALNADIEYAPAYYFYAKFLSADPKAREKVKTTAQEYLKREPKGEYAADATRLAGG